MRSIVTYETHHGSAKKLAQAIAGKLDCLCIDVDTPFQAEDESGYDTLITVFGFRGPYHGAVNKALYPEDAGKAALQEHDCGGSRPVHRKGIPGCSRKSQEHGKAVYFQHVLHEGPASR